MKKIQVIGKWQRLMILAYRERIAQLEKENEMKTSRLSYLENELTLLKPLSNAIKTKIETLM